MTYAPDELISGYLDGTLTADEEAALNVWVKAAPENARAFAAAVVLHDRLRDAVRVASAAQPVPAEPGPGRAKGAVRARLLGAAAALVAAVLAVVWWASPAPLSAASELDRLIDAPAATTDRTYRIRNLDAEPEQPDDRRPPIDGATLHARGPDRYVLVRAFPDGRPFVTGSDGERSWSVPPDDRAVRVSSDPLRFRGPVPGHQHGLPFVDLHSDLVQLRVAYSVARLPPDAAGLRGLRAEKKSPEFRGARRVDLWYEPRTGVIHRMVFDGMPQARGGPHSVSVELVEQRELDPQFFRHESHHAPNRKVIEED
jgi:hypothetical protein